MRRRLICAVAALLIVGSGRPAAYSALGHETVVDSAWDDVVAPLLRQRFPRASAVEVDRARAFAYGGSVIQDLGYYPFGSTLFTNLVHYVRSGDFVESLVRESRTVDELAFALGALAHYAADNIGHPEAVNRAVPLMYPKLQPKYGAEVIYADDPKRHVMVEFAFDVVQVASGAYLPDGFRAYIGFEVAKPVLQRAFLDTYGLELKDLFQDEDLAIGTYRYAISQAIPELTRVAWKHKQDEIRKVAPTVQRSAFVYSETRRDYEAEFGTSYRRPGWFARFLGTLVRILPKIGPLAVLAFEVPTPEAERLFAESFRATRERYRTMVVEARDGTIELANTDFDVGRQARWGGNAVADETYVELLETYAARNFGGMPAALRQEVRQFFANAHASDAQGNAGKKSRKALERVRPLLAALDGSP